MVCEKFWNAGVIYIKHHFLHFGSFGPKNQNCFYKLKFGASTNPGRWNTMVMFTFSDLDEKCSFWANSVK